MEPTRQEAIPKVPPPAPPPRDDSQEGVLRGRGVHANALRTWSEFGRTLGCLSSMRESLGSGKNHTLESKTFHAAWEESHTCG